MIRLGALALAPSLLILMLSLPQHRDQVEARWEDSPPGERMVSLIEAVRPPPEGYLEVPPPPPPPAIVAPAPAPSVAAAAVYIPPPAPSPPKPQTAARTIAPVPLAVAPASGDLATLVAAYFPGQEAKAMSVMKCESGYNPQAVSPAGDRGLMQISAVHARYDPALGTSFIGSLGYTWDDMLSPGPNLAVAAALHRKSGWGPWSCA